MWKANHTKLTDAHKFEEFKRQLRRKGCPENYLNILTTDLVKAQLQEVSDDGYGECCANKEE